MSNKTIDFKFAIVMPRSLSDEVATLLSENKVDFEGTREIQSTDGLDFGGLEPSDPLLWYVIHFVGAVGFEAVKSTMVGIWYMRKGPFVVKLPSGEIRRFKKLEDLESFVKELTRSGNENGL